MSAHTYPRAVLVHDGARCALALTLCAAPLAILDTSAAVTAGLAALALVFALGGLHVIGVHVQRLEIGEDGIATSGPPARRLRWSEVAGITLAYYSTRYDREGGWFELALADHARHTIRLDSRLRGFSIVAAHAAAAARRYGVGCDRATVHNFRALGLPMDRLDPRPAEPGPTAPRLAGRSPR